MELFFTFVFYRELTVNLKTHLNPQQLEAVTHLQGPLLVLAGAGSGKTRVITYRIAYLIHEHNVEPYQILGVTFTNKAASEMKQRVMKLAGRKAAGVTLSTFHSLGLRILREHGDRIGYRRNFTIYNEGDQLSLVRTLLREHEKRKEKFDAGILLSRISSYKDNLIHGKAEVPVFNDKYDLVFQDIFQRYQSSLRACQAVDFDDLILLPIQLFEKHSDVLDIYANRFKHILVDEYQDTNDGQCRFMAMLSSKNRNICVVGDDDQSIYGWRGAQVRNILQFEKEYRNAKVIKLEQNYRSTQVILDAAYHVIKNNYTRQEKRLWTQRGRGRNIDAFVANDENDEAKTIAWRLRTIQERTQARWSDFAVLYRSNVQSRALETAFRISKIPYTVAGGYEFFERKEVKDLVSYLRVIHNPHDDLNLLRILNYPRRGIGDSTTVKLSEQAQREGVCMYEMLKKHCHNTNLSKTARKGMHEFIEMVDHLHQKSKVTAVPVLVREVIEKSRYREELERTIEDPMTAQMKIEMVEEMASAAASFEEQEEKGTLINFIDSISLGDEPGNNAKKKPFENSVLLATLHSAKGLEFPYLFLCGMEEDLLPHARSVGDNNEIDEERRLCYVGITRAQVHLTLSFAQERTKFGRKRRRTPSRFLKEIPEAFLCKQFSHSPHFFDKQQIKHVIEE